MPTPFGPQLIGETEKTLNALLCGLLEPTGLSEPEWVTLRLAGQLDGNVDAAGLITAVADRAHFANAAELVAELTGRGQLAGGRLTPSGRELVASLQATITNQTAPIWRNLPDGDVDCTARLLNEVILRARRVLDLSKQ
jgi:hypothetical protein